MKMYQVLFLSFLALFLVACNDDDSEVASPATGESVHYYTWDDSANGEWVLDANGDKVRFEVDTGWMYFGKTAYTNAQVDTGNSSEFRLDGILYGSVMLVKDTQGNNVAALVAIDGTYLDIQGSEDNLKIENTDIPFLAASAPSSDNSQTLPKSIPLPASNAFATSNNSGSGWGILRPPQ